MRPRRERLDRPFPMVRVLDRELTGADAGAAFVWDIDKTYLDTRFSQLKHLARIPFEFGVDKHAVPGAVELLQGLRDGPGGHDLRPLFFVSASPPQIASAVERKMLLDGVAWDGILYKDPLRALLQGRFAQLKAQVAFKLAALVVLARELPAGVTLHLFGDDVEADPFIYCLFADVAAGRVRGEALSRLLAGHGVRPGDARALVEDSAALAARERVAGIHIRLTRVPDGASIAPFGPQVRGYPTFASAALHLHGLGLLSAQACERVVAAAGPSQAVCGAAAAGPSFLPASMGGAAGVP